jgi:hypothetical protein
MDNASTLELEDPPQHSGVVLERRRAGRIEYSNPALKQLLRLSFSHPLAADALDSPSNDREPALDPAQPGGLRSAIRATHSLSSPLADTPGAMRQTSSLRSQSVETAVALARRYCRDDRYEQNWVELLDSKVEKIRGFLVSADYPRAPPDGDSINALIGRLVSLSETARRICLVCGRWGTPEANRTVARVIRSLGFRAHVAGEYSYWCELRALCASLCFYWALAGTLAREDFTIARSLMHTRLARNTGEEPAIATLPLLALGAIDWKVLKGFEQQRVPASDFLYGLFEQEVADADARDAECLFDRLEFLISLEFSHVRLARVAESTSALWFWTPLGRYVCKRGGDGIVDRLAEHENLPADHALLQAGLLGGSPASAARAVQAMRQVVTSHPSLLRG